MENVEMKHLNGKRIRVWDMNGHAFEGVCTGVTDDIVRLLKDGETDERCFFIRNIHSYVVIGEGATGGYSGLKAYVCKNPSINCAGRCRISSTECRIVDMGCEVCNKKTAQGTGFRCDFGCIGAIEVLPSKVQRVLFDGMVVDRNVRKNYLEEARKEIEKDTGAKQDVLQREEHGEQG